MIQKFYIFDIFAINDINLEEHFLRVLMLPNLTNQILASKCFVRFYFSSKGNKFH